MIIMNIEFPTALFVCLDFNIKKIVIKTLKCSVKFCDKGQGNGQSVMFSDVIKVRESAPFDWPFLTR